MAKYQKQKKRKKHKRFAVASYSFSLTPSFIKALKELAGWPTTQILDLIISRPD